MYSVYKITNKINNKCYIGSSIRVEKRWKEHINISKNPNNPQYNYPLYSAFRKYGIENFTFEILKDDFNSIKEMTDYEHQMIIYYQGYECGYNQTLLTDRADIANENIQKHIKNISQRCAKIDINNNILEIYNSYHEAARKNDMNGDYRATSIRQVCKGEIGSLNGIIFRDLDKDNNIIYQPFKRPHGKKTIICIPVDETQPELFFESIFEASRKLPANRQSIGKCIKGDNRYSIVKGYIIRELDLYGNIIENNISIQDRIDKYNLHNPLINGERHSISKWSKIYNISRQTVMNRIKNGIDIVEAITTPTRR